MKDTNSTSCFVPDLNLWVPFKSRSDALFAQLVTIHNLTWPTIDAVLSVVLNPDFAISNLTVRSGGDIVNRISDMRTLETLAREHSYASRSPASTHIIPHTVVDLVVEHLRESLSALDRDRGACAVQIWLCRDGARCRESFAIKCELPQGSARCAVPRQTRHLIVGIQPRLPVSSGIHCLTETGGGSSWQSRAVHGLRSQTNCAQIVGEL